MVSIMHESGSQSSRPHPGLASNESRPALGRLGLGTVQFGVDYGIANDAGQCSPETTRDILAEAKRLGLRMLDTAPAYGQAERALGRYAADEHFRVVTKTMPLPGDSVTDREVEAVGQTFTESLQRLGRDAAYGILIHHAEDLLKPGGSKLWEALVRLRAENRVSKIGVSVYEAGQIDRVMERYEIDLVQLPINVFDQRLIQSGHLKSLKEAGVEIHARSVFLQGLLLMTPERIPSFFEPAMPHLRRYHGALEADGISRTEAALSFVRQVPEIDIILVGVDSVKQLRENVAAYQSERAFDYPGFALDNLAVLDPKEWPSR